MSGQTAEPADTAAAARPRRRRAEDRRMLDRLKQYQEHWATLSEPEREIEELLATRELLQGDMVDEDGNICSLWDYAVNTQLEELSAETGFARDTDEDPEDIIESKPGWMLRRNAPKMQLRPSEEDNLGLSCMGQGFRAHFTPVHGVPGIKNMFPPKLDFAYGVFCKADLVEQLLDRFAGRAPGEVLLADRYYQDLILHSPQLETTVMLVATRDLPLANLQRDCIGKLMEQVQRGITFSHLDRNGKEQSTHLKASPDDVRQAEELATVFTPAVLKGLPFMTADGKYLKKHTKLYLSTTPLGGFCVEAESPGTLTQQRSFYIGDYTSKHLTYALLDLFMGPAALDPVARIDIGACFLYFANGFKFDDAEGVPGRVEESVQLLRHSDDYFHPMGYLIAPEGKAVPGLQPDAHAEPAELASPQPAVPEAQPVAAELEAADDGMAATPPAAAPSSVPQAASLTLARFSLPALLGGGRQGSAGGPFDPGYALQQLRRQMKMRRFRS
eukprot:jgi/Ulvmu1/9018/UM005_0109.1